MKIFKLIKYKITLIFFSIFTCYIHTLTYIYIMSIVRDKEGREERETDVSMFTCFNFNILHQNEHFICIAYLYILLIMLNIK